MDAGKLLGKPNKLWGNDLRWTSIPSRGSRNTPSRFMLQMALRLRFFFIPTRSVNISLSFNLDKLNAK